jgi:hypothetical protein
MSVPKDEQRIENNGQSYISQVTCLMISATAIYCKKSPKVTVGMDSITHYKCFSCILTLAMLDSPNTDADLLVACSPDDHIIIKP